MKCELLKKEGCKREFSVKVPSQEMSDYEKAVIENFNKNAKIKGFRPGKVPNHMVEKFYKSQIISEIINKCMQDILSKVFIELNFQPLNEPIIKKFDYDLRKDLDMEGYVEVLPEFELASYENLNLEKYSDEVSDSDVLGYIKQMADYSAPFETIENRTAEDNDYAIIDFKIFNGETVVESKDGSWVKLSKDTDDEYMKTLFDNIIGMKIGEEKDTDIKLPDSYADESLAGKTAKIHFMLKGIREKKVPEINDEYAKKISPEYETLDMYKEKVRVFLSNQKKSRNNENLKEQIKKQLSESNNFELPPSILKTTINDYYNYNVSQLSSKGMSKDIIEEKKEELMKEASITGAEQLKLEFIYREIIEKEKLETTDEDYQNELLQESLKVGMTKEALEKYLKSNKKLSYFRQNILINKIFKLIIERANIKELSN